MTAWLFRKRRGPGNRPPAFRPVARRSPKSWPLGGDRPGGGPGGRGGVDINEKKRSKPLRRLEVWPPAAAPWRGDEMERYWRLIRERPAWQSINYVVASARGLLLTKQVAAHMGVSESWVRWNLPEAERHHSYKQKGKGGLAIFFDPADVLEALREDPGLCRRAARLWRKS